MAQSDAQLATIKSGSVRTAVARRLRSELPSELRELVGDLRGAKRPWSSEAGKLARELAPLWPEACLDLVRTAQRHDVRAAAAVSAGLDGWDREDQSVPPALTARVIEAGWRDLYTQLSLHPLATVRQLALRARWRSGLLPLDEVASLIRDDESSLVQRMLVKELAVEPKPEFLEPLLSLAANTWADHSTSPGEPAQYPIARLAADALTEISDIPDGKVREVFKTALRTDDRHVRWLLLLALGVRGSDRTRERLGAFVVDPQRRLTHRQAVADAMVLAAEHLGPGSFPSPPVAAIVGAPAALAVALTRLLTQTATPAQLVDAAKQMNATVSRRVLLLLLNGRGAPALGEELAQLLPDRHPARRLLQRPKAKSRLPRASVDDLDDILFVEAVRQALGDQFEPELQASPPSHRRTRRRRPAPWRGFVRSLPPNGTT